MTVGVTITVQRRPTTDDFGDASYADHHTVTGCTLAPQQSRESTDRRNTVVVPMTLYAPPGADVQATDRVLVHPPGVDTIHEDDTDLRRRITYQVTGDAADWSTEVTGWPASTVWPSLLPAWRPGLEVTLEKVK